SEAIQADAPVGAVRATSVAVGMPGAAPGAVSSAATPVQLWHVFGDDLDALGRFVDEITRRLPHELLIVIEQGEDLLTRGAGSEPQRRQTALAMLANLASSSARCKVILTLRTEFFGQLS